MAQELVYTSTPRGLRLGSSGFCTVACTRGMAPNYIETLESLSGYTPVFPPNHPQANANPLAFSHHRFTIGGKPVSVLSRVAAAGVDYTKRPNKFAHHLVLDVRERSAGGPAWVMQQPGVFMDHWEGDPRFLDQPRKIPAGDSPTAPCKTWQTQLGDAAWAGVLAQAFLDDPARPSFIVFKPGMPVLTLIDEALRLIPVERRWEVSFSTYFMSLPARTNCAWRCCLAGSRVLKQARRMPDALVLDLDAGGDQSPGARRQLQEGSALIAYARTGTPPPALSSGAPAAKQPRTETPLAMEADRAVGSNANGAHPRSPANVWLESAPRQPAPKSTRGLKIVLGAVIVMLLISLAMNIFLPVKRSSSDTSETQGEGMNPSNPILPGENARAQGEAATLSQDSEEVQQLRKAIDTLKKARDRFETEKATLTQANRDIAAERNSLRKQLAETDVALGEAQKELAALKNAQKPSAVACLGQLDRMNLEKKSTHQVRAEGLSDNGKVTAIGWWDKTNAIEQNEITRDGDALVISAPHPSQVGLVEWVTISVTEKAIVFNRMPNSPQTSDRMDKLKNIGWIELDLDGKKVIAFMQPRPEDIILLKRQPHGGYDGSVEAEHILLQHGLERRWKLGSSLAEDLKVCELKRGKPGTLHLSLEFNSDDIQVRSRAFSQPIELLCDRQVIASFNLTLE